MGRAAAARRAAALLQPTTAATGRGLDGCRRWSSSRRDYADALDKLALLQSNRATTSRFTGPAAAAATRELNAAALPEMLAWLRRAGYEARDLAAMRHLHVAGTKGKGSVCAYATAMLVRHGARVGTYTSPHLVSPRERIAIDGRPVSQDLFARAFFELWDRFGDAARREGADADAVAARPFFFRFMTILAWHIFLACGVEDVVLEAGIGGEYDATNVVPAEAVSAAVISQLGVDHVAMLGDTVEAIAWHKAGILKPGVTGFTRRLPAQPRVMAVLRARAAAADATLVEVDDAAVAGWGGVAGALPGADDVQARNQALAALAVAKHLGLPATAAAAADPAAVLRALPPHLAAALRDARLRGRCELVEPPGAAAAWLLDGAHTHESLREAARWLAASLRSAERVVLVFNQQERDAGPLLATLVAAVAAETGRPDVFDRALFTPNELAPAPAVDTAVQDAAAATMRRLLPACHTSVFTNVADAVAEAEGFAARRGGQARAKVLVTGSLHLVGAVLRALEPNQLL